MKNRSLNGMHVPPRGPVPLKGTGVDGGDGPDPETLRDYKDRIKAVPDLRDEVVEDLRDAVESGSYHIESEKLAKKVVDEAIREAVQRERPSPR